MLQLLAVAVQWVQVLAAKLSTVAATHVAQAHADAELLLLHAVHQLLARNPVDSLRSCSTVAARAAAAALAVQLQAVVAKLLLLQAADAKLLAADAKKVLATYHQVTMRS